jgi:prepilin-type processing-associated H-X9-DG protein
MWFLTGLYNCPFGCARRKAYTVTCQNNLKSLSLALHRYAEQHDSRLPSADNWMNAIKPYVDNPQVFRCPHTPAHLQYSYGFNKHLGGVSLNDLSDPANAVLLYESVSGLPNAHDDPSRLRFISWDSSVSHGYSHQRARFAFADGHVKEINMGRYEEELDNRQIQVKP